VAAPIVQVTTTVPTATAAAAVATALVDTGLAACVQVSGPVRSRYRWQGAVEEADEWCCVAKTTAAAAPAAVAAIRAVHPYDVPEILVTPVVGGHDAYLAWVAAEVTPA
jgi:periplasmic divalent cation tolerance protein